MKSLVLFAILMAITASGLGAVLQRVEKAEPVEYIETHEEIDGEAVETPYDFLSVIDSRNNRHLFSGAYSRSAIDNVVQVNVLSVQFGDDVRISSIETRADQSATVLITAGGVGTNHVTIRMESAIGSGFNINVDIYGH